MSVDAYALALLALNDSKTDINAENIISLLKKSKCENNKQTAELFAEVAKFVNLEELLAKFSKVGGAPVAAAPVATSGAPAAAAPTKEVEKSESEESEADMGFGLFD